MSVLDYFLKDNEPEPTVQNQKRKGWNDLMVLMDIAEKTTLDGTDKKKKKDDNSKGASSVKNMGSYLEPYLELFESKQPQPPEYDKAKDQRLQQMMAVNALGKVIQTISDLNSTSKHGAPALERTDKVTFPSLNELTRMRTTRDQYKQNYDQMSLSNLMNAVSFAHRDRGQDIMDERYIRNEGAYMDRELMRQNRMDARLDKSMGADKERRESDYSKEMEFEEFKSGLRKGETEHLYSQKSEYEAAQREAAKMSVTDGTNTAKMQPEQFNHILGNAIAAEAEKNPVYALDPDKFKLTSEEANTLVRTYWSEYYTIKDGILVAKEKGAGGKDPLGLGIDFDPDNKEQNPLNLDFETEIQD